MCAVKGQRLKRSSQTVKSLFTMWQSGQAAINGTLYELASQWEVNACGLIPVALSKLIVPDTVHDVASHTGAV